MNHPFSASPSPGGTNWQHTLQPLWCAGTGEAEGRGIGDIYGYIGYPIITYHCHFSIREKPGSSSFLIYFV